MPEPDKILSQGEVDALLSAIGSGEVEISHEVAAETPAVAYDFKRPQRVTRDQIRALETLHETFARNLQAGLSSLLRTMVDVKVNRIDQLSFQEFIHSLPNPTVLTVLSAEPLEGSFLMELNPGIAFPFIERLLGSGKVGGGQPERALTPIEWNLIGTVLARATELLSEIWAAVGNVRFKVTARESDPPVVRVHRPNEALLGVSLEISMGEHRGVFNIAFPVMVLEGQLDRLAAHEGLTSRRKERAPGQEAALTRRLAPAEVVLMAHLPVESLPMKALRTLKPGDLLLTGHPKDAPVVLSVEGRPKFVAKFGGLKDRKAVKVVAPADAQLGDAPRSEMSVRPGEEGAAVESPAPAIVPALLQIGLTQSVVLSEKAVSIRDVLGMKVGDVVEFPKPASEPLELRVGRHTVAEGTAVRLGERFGFLVGTVRDPRDTVVALGS